MATPGGSSGVGVGGTPVSNVATPSVEAQVSSVCVGMQVLALRLALLAFLRSPIPARTALLSHETAVSLRSLTGGSVTSSPTNGSEPASVREVLSQRLRVFGTVRS